VQFSLDVPRLSILRVAIVKTVSVTYLCIIKVAYWKKWSD